MNIIGWIALSILGIFGFILMVMLMAYFITVEFRIFTFKVDSNLNLKKEDINLKSQAKKERLARLRATKEEISEMKLNDTIEKIKDKAKKRRKPKKEVEDIEPIEYIEEEIIEEEIAEPIEETEEEVVESEVTDS